VTGNLSLQGAAFLWAFASCFGFSSFWGAPVKEKNRRGVPVRRRKEKEG
jgi:hypothetical protein